MPWIDDTTYKKCNDEIVKTKFKPGDSVQYKLMTGRRREIHISTIVKPFVWMSINDPNDVTIGYVLEDDTRVNEAQLSGVGEVGHA